MKLLIKSRNQAAAQAVEEGETSYDVPNATIAWGTIILAVIQAAATLLGNYLTITPKQQADKYFNVLKEKNQKIQLLQRVLENSDSTYRANSLKLLIAAELISDPDNKMLEIIKDPAAVPKWDKHPLETFNGTAESTVLEPNSASTNSGGSRNVKQDTTQKTKPPVSPARPETAQSNN